MKTTRRFAAALALAACAACADTTSSNQPVMTPDQPAGTSGTTGTISSDPTQVNPSDRGVVPVGQEMDVRLRTALSSATATREQRFEATTAVDLMQGDRC
ncbi:MAG: hypothetical protein M3541_14470 [Acidobacteriota bacterium]|nr:hypothetical protein [Acidobacteriota bacterium]MDQ3419954.1 hypothetical protein [Acidobacteriota bacterium]